MEPRGDLFIISAPSGAGKTSLVKALLNTVSNLSVSISHTTRLCRQNERNGVDYHFVDMPEFEKLLAKQAFLEHALVFGHYYGTTRVAVEKSLQAGQDVILEIDWQGAQQIRAIWPTTISVFIFPPSITELSARLINRRRDDAMDIKHRLAQAQEEMSHYTEFDYLVCNDDFDLALDDLKSIVRCARLRERRQVIQLGAMLNSQYHLEPKI